jgi:hypothetical protein
VLQIRGEVAVLQRYAQRFDDLPALRFEYIGKGLLGFETGRKVGD